MFLSVSFLTLTDELFYAHVKIEKKCLLHLTDFLLLCKYIYINKLMKRQIKTETFRVCFESFNSVFASFLPVLSYTVNIQKLYCDNVFFYHWSSCEYVKS